MKAMFIMFIVSIFSSVLIASDQLIVGDPAPDFALPDGEGKLHKLSDYRGKIVALYFYPKDDTPGCTAEACNLRDNYDSLLTAGIIVLGVSFDDTAAHKKFAAKYHLPFPLLSDSEKKVAELYGAKGGATRLMMAKRITYLIDKDGKILHVFDKVDAGNHARQILDILKQKK